MDGDECPGPFDAALARIETHWVAEDGRGLARPGTGWAVLVVQVRRVGVSTMLLNVFLKGSVGVASPPVPPRWLWDCGRRGILQGGSTQ